ncbi:1,4-alpha-glucan branching enzyme [Halobacteroides halobius DSM 5150]|uniref:pullulanase n=1 Tax=Halobacteroides halobius (strain ATCC 35273 / DSM 5150 / MD-1) TaxID=748449 RepID=L0K815_HALHC|nr:alpha-amylase family glycosyl hydrolase [Halobacteroides halobius]AGB41166.1 1,4-alpha-glucan branching enzyme [Halobacteroides halobius DSM 5150]
MRNKIRIHYDNGNNFSKPRLWIWTIGSGSLEREIEPVGEDEYGVYYDVMVNRNNFYFKFKDIGKKGVIWEDDENNREYNAGLGGEIWSKAGIHNIYSVKPDRPIGHIKEVYNKIKDLIPQENFYLPQTDVSGGKVHSLLGAHKLTDGSISFALFHPRAAKVSLSLNQEDKLVELELYRGFYNQPNIWWGRIPATQVKNRVEYKFYVQGGTAGNERLVYDPYTRVYSDDYKLSNCVVVDPTEFQWTDEEWQTPDISQLIIYELNVYGFTDGDSDIPLEDQSTFRGITKRIKDGYFADLGITALALMPTSEAWSHFGLGYDPCSFMSVEHDFGSPDDFREMINTAHQHGLAVIIDQVFNHTSNDFNPLWKLIDDGSSPGGLYFDGSTKWGNKLATGRDEVDNMLIDSCKLFIKEYHIDGFRFDATHSNYTDHKLLYQIQDEIRNSGFKSNAILIAENLPNQSDLNFAGYNGYAQWADLFHDKMKALIREGVFRNWCDDSPNNLGDMFYFCKNQFAKHTNNVINYSESHDEPSIRYEVETNNILDCNIKDRKARLAMMATMVALGQPMIYMGQEFGVNRKSNVIDIDTVTPDPNCPEYEYNDFYRWTQKLIKLRKRYDALKISGSNPVETDQFSWMIGPWMSDNKGANRKVIGWRTKSGHQEMLILLNFGNKDVDVDLEFPAWGRWIKLADIKEVNDLPPVGTRNPANNSLEVQNNIFSNFTLPPYSGFIYKKATGRN